MEPLRYLQEVNEWWTSGNVNPVLLQKLHRDEFNELVELLDSDRITAVIGPRRVGKDHAHVPVDRPSPGHRHTKRAHSLRINGRPPGQNDG
ncbi:MAG: hypothetical protein P1P72_03835 [ANME-2 cluster archaeon]|nr:hypothetical protein [ANME-2 cluster archaeon]